MKLLLVLLITITACVSNPPPQDNAPILAFQKIEAGLYRGAQPDLQGMEYLKSIGIKYILDLNNNPDLIKAESQQAENLQMAFFSIPLSGFWAPSNQDLVHINQILESNAPIYVHCEHGHDRTGLVIGLYRQQHNGFTKVEAWNEMIKEGFHPILFPLTWYFWTH